MAKNTPFFKFDSSAWLGGSIQFTDLASKGLFIDLCALYWESQKPVKIDTKFKVRVRCDEGTLSDLLDTLSDLDIIVQSEHGITVPFLDYLMSERNKWLEKCSKAGKKSSSSKGTSSNKKEERRKKNVESRYKKRFIPPTLEEVKSYFNEHGFCQLIAERAFRGYSENNWHDSKNNPIKNWKSKMNNVWFEEKNRSKASTSKFDPSKWNMN